jgi:hypothetical protein
MTTLQPTPQAVNTAAVSGKNRIIASQIAASVQPEAPGRDKLEELEEDDV